MTIEVLNVTKTFGNYRALDNVSLTVADGELVALLGPSGSGKTTLLRLIAGLEEPDPGEGTAIRFDGEDVASRGVGQRQVGFVFQHYALFRHMSVFENVAFGLRVRPRATRPSEAAIREKVSSLLKLVQLDGFAKRYPSQLSGGQRQRIAIARMMLKNAPILILDEATSALDSEIEAAIQENLYHLMEGKTVIAVAHRLSTIAALDRLVVIDEGRIVEEGTHEALIQRDGLYAQLWKRQSGGFLASSLAAE